MLPDIRNADAWVNQNKIFNGLNLQIEQGEKIAVPGPNGAGKSTLLKLITREISPVIKEKSYIRLYGSEIINLWELREKNRFTLSGSTSGLHALLYWPEL